MKFLRIILAVLLIYLLTYAGLSLCGSYQPAAVGLDHVEEYAWAPFGFYDQNQPWVGPVKSPTELTTSRSGIIAAFFGPLWELDKHYFHAYRSNL